MTAPSAALSASFDLPLGPEAATLARSATLDVLRLWGAVDGCRLDDALLVVSELVGNAVRHGAAHVLLTVQRAAPAQGGLLTLGVQDGSAVLPQAPQDRTDAESGRGLRIVDVLSRRWGVAELGPGKRVWAELTWPA